MTHADCGHLTEECSDPERTVYAYRRICRISMERQAAEAFYEALHEKQPFHDGTFTRWSAKRTLGFPYRFNEGVTIGADFVDRAPHDEFTTKADASPLPPESDVAVGSEKDDHDGAGDDDLTDPVAV